MSADAKQTLPPKALLCLTVLVLAAHLVLLQGAPLTLGLAQPQPARPFTTRTLKPPPTPTPAVKPPVKAPNAVPLPPPSTELAPATESPPPAPSHAGQDASGAATQVVSAEVAPAPATSPPAQPVEPTPPSTEIKDMPSIGSKFDMPGAVRIKYAVESNKFPFSANGEMLWQQDGETYEMQQEWGAIGLSRTRTSKGQITPAGLAPQRFSDKFRSEVAAHFEREKGKVSFSANTPDVPLQVGAQDQLSIFAQLAAMLAGNSGHFREGTSLSIQIVGPRTADTWLIAVMGEEKLILPGGELMAMKLVRNPNREYDQKLELWMAPVLNYLPARIRITEPNGDFVDQKWLATVPQN